MRSIASQVLACTGDRAKPVQVLISYILLLGAARQARGFIIGLLASVTVRSVIAIDLLQAGML